MRLALYSPRPSLLERQWEILAEFTATACLDLEVHSFDSYDALLEEAAQGPFDALFYDIAEAGDPSERLLRFCQVLPHCPLALLGGKEEPSRTGLPAVGWLAVPLDEEEYLTLLIYLIREARYG